MTDPDGPSQLRRAHRAKRRGAALAGWVDGGAISAGLLIPLAAYAPTMLDILPEGAALGLIATGVLVGGNVAGRFTAASTTCRACHGALTGVAFLFIAGAIALAAAIAGGHPGVPAPAARAIEQPAWLVLGIGLGGLGGALSRM